MQICFIFLVLFSKKNHGFIQEGNPPTHVIVEEELDGIDTDDIGNVEDSTTLHLCSLMRNEIISQKSSQ